METRDFRIGDVLSVTSAHLVSPRGMEGVYDILNFMTGDQLFTHQLPRAARECRPFLLEQYPALADLDETNCGPETWEVWLAEQVERFGKALPIRPIPPHMHEFIDPLSELAEKVHPSKIIVVDGT
ncbi:MAG: hypothetical protein ACR2RF_05990 [Geminicoccaceae bacterium]